MKPTEKTIQRRINNYQGEIAIAESLLGKSRDMETLTTEEQTMVVSAVQTRIEQHKESLEYLLEHEKFGDE
jgi:hypothetical protein